MRARGVRAWFRSSFTTARGFTSPISPLNRHTPCWIIIRHDDWIRLQPWADGNRTGGHWSSNLLNRRTRRRWNWKSNSWSDSGGRGGTSGRGGLSEGGEELSCWNLELRRLHKAFIEIICSPNSRVNHFGHFNKNYLC